MFGNGENLLLYNGKGKQALSIHYNLEIDSENLYLNMNIYRFKSIYIYALLDCFKEQETIGTNINFTLERL